MIKCEIEEREGVIRLSFTSNKRGDDLRHDLDTLDAIGNAILTRAPKRGSYNGDTLLIDIKKNYEDGDV